MTTYDRLIKHGHEQGIEKKAVEMVRKTIVECPTWSDNKIAKFVGVKLDLVKQIRQEIANDRS